MKKGTFLLGFSFLVSKILGLLRDNLLASQFGASTDLDIYYAAFRIPDLLFNLLSYGILSAAFVPIFVEILEKEGREKAFKFTNDIVKNVGFAVLGISIILFAAAPLMLKLFVPGFGEEELSRTILATRIMLVTPFFFTLGSIAGGVSNALHKFLGMSLAPIFYNLSIIAGILVFGKTYGVYGIAMGVAAGSVLHAAVQFPGIIKNGFRFRWRPSWFPLRVKEMIILSLPRIFGMSVTQLSLIVDTLIASTLATGSITVINFASNVESLPIGIIGISIAIVSFGTLSTFSAQGNMTAFVNEIRQGIRRILFLLMPLSLGMLALRFEIIQIIFGYGRFTAGDIERTSKTLAVFLVGLIFGGLIFLLARAFYALKNTKTPVMVGIAAVTVNIIISILLTKFWHLETLGLAWANSIADIINAGILIVLLSKKVETSVLDSKEILKYLIAASVMALVVIGIKSAIDSLLLRTAASVIAGAATYFTACRILKCRTDLKTCAIKNKS